ncbi:hypothetical protein VMCG_05089 [Cytospora schulzeri]|uniref:Uncharacterized protein n=1 Tax=Cytospora schulzeri TaxID=448051 RepID=A0A423WMG1_9PEZI|nr:hypothetical protein VMCG_05089 [Valsa malicola]
MRSRPKLAPQDSSRTESPIPWVQSDVAGASSSRPRRICRPSQKFRESQVAGAEGGDVSNDVPVRTPTSSCSQPNDEHLQHKAGITEFQALKSRLAEVEQERDGLRDSLHRANAELSQKGERLLMLKTRILTASAAASKPRGPVKSTCQEEARANRSSKVSTPLSPVDDVILAEPGPLDQAGVHPQAAAPTTAFEATKDTYDVVRKRWPETLPDMLEVHTPLLHLPVARQLVHRPQREAFQLGNGASRNLRAALCNGMSGMCTWTAAGGAYTLPLYEQARDSHEKPTESHSDIQPGFVDGSEQHPRVLKEQHTQQWSARDDQIELIERNKENEECHDMGLISKKYLISQDTESGVDKRSSRQCDKFEAPEKEDWGIADCLLHNPQASERSGEATAYRAQEMKALQEKAQGLEVDLANLQEKNMQLIAEKDQLKSQLRSVAPAHVNNTKDGARKDDELQGKIARLEADLAGLKDVDSAKRQLEFQRIERDQEIAALKGSVKDLRAKLDKQVKEHEELQNLFKGAEDAADYLEKERRAWGKLKDSETALKREQERHKEVLRALEAKAASLTQEAAAAAMAAKATEDVLQEERSNHAEERRSLEAEAEIYRTWRKRVERERQLKTDEVKILSLAFEAKEQEEIKLQTRIRGLEAEIASLKKEADTALEASRVALEEEKAKHVEKLRDLGATKQEELRELRAKFDLVKEARDTAAKSGKIALQKEKEKHAEVRCCLESKIERLHGELRDLEGKIVSITTAKHNQDVTFQEERAKHTKGIETLESEVKTLSLSLEAKGQEETRLKDQLHDAQNRIVSLVATSLNQEVALEEQKAQYATSASHIEALQKELSQFRDKIPAMIEAALAEMDKHTREASSLREDIDGLYQAHTQAINTINNGRENSDRFFQNLVGEYNDHIEQLNKAEEVRQESYTIASRRILELETATRQFEEELEGAGQIRLEIQAGANRRISELEECIGEQTQSLQEAKEEARQALAVEADKIKLLKDVASLTQNLSQLEAISSDDKKYQQTTERFLDCVRLQVSRKLEDELTPRFDVEAAKGATMGALQEMLTEKLDYIERKLNWYERVCDEYWERYVKEHNRRSNIEREYLSCL